MNNSDRNERLRTKAREQYQRDGEIEVDDDAIVCQPTTRSEFGVE